MAQGFQFLIVRGAETDMMELRRVDPPAASVVARLLTEIVGGFDLCEKLVDEDYYDDVIQEVGQVYSLQARRLNAYRVKLVQYGRWRLITAICYRTKRIALMAVMPRESEYEANHVLWDRIEDDYDAVGFVRLGR